MNVLVVHAHHEKKSFSSALKNTLVETLQQQGHQVTQSDLYEMQFDPISDRRNFISSKNDQYLKQHDEELEAFRTGNFDPDLEIEMQKLEKCDLLVLSFPLWWMGAPAILKGWFDRVFAAGRISVPGKRFENAFGAAQKKALVLLTTGEPEAHYMDSDLFPPLRQVLLPLQQGVLWRHGFLPLDPFVSFAPELLTSDERTQELARLRIRLGGVWKEPSLSFAKEQECNEEGRATARRYMMVFRRAVGVTDSELTELTRSLPNLVKFGSNPRIHSFRTSSPEAQAWRLFVEVGAGEKSELLTWHMSHPILRKLPHEVHELTTKPITERNRRLKKAHSVKVSKLNTSPTALGLNQSGRTSGRGEGGRSTTTTRVNSAIRLHTPVSVQPSTQPTDSAKNKRLFSWRGALVDAASRSYHLAPLLSVFRKDM